MKLLQILSSIAILFALTLPAAAGDVKGTLAGRVVDERGKAIAGARVAIDGDGAHEATTDAKGEFRIDLDPGSYRLRFEADGYASSTLRDPVTIAAGKETKLKQKVELPAADRRSVVRGSVFDEAGRSVRGAKVVLERVPGEGQESVAPLKMEAKSDSLGMFAFRVPEGEGRYRLTATVEKRAPATVTVDVFGGEIVNAPPLKIVASTKEK